MAAESAVLAHSVRSGSVVPGLDEQLFSKGSGPCSINSDINNGKVLLLVLNDLRCFLLHSDYYETQCSSSCFNHLSSNKGD